MIWISVEEGLPEEGVLVLAIGHVHTGEALARRFIPMEKNSGKDGPFWEVQPFKDAWYWTYEGVTHWTAIPAAKSEA